MNAGTPRPAPRRAAPRRGRRWRTAPGPAAPRGRRAPRAPVRPTGPQARAPRGVEGSGSGHNEFAASWGGVQGGLLTRPYPVRVSARPVSRHTYPDMVLASLVLL